jgi:hypothetical protein
MKFSLFSFNKVVINSQIYLRDEYAQHLQNCRKLTMLELLFQAGSYLFWLVLGPDQLAVGLCSAIPPESFLCSKQRVKN